MAQGPIDHPSYLTRQTFRVGKTTAGANTVLETITFPFDIRIRNAVTSINVAGTSTSPGASLVFYCPGTSYQYPASVIPTGVFGTASVAVNGSALTTSSATNTTTTTLGFIPTGTAVANAVVASGDMNFRIPAGQLLVIKNGTDATGVVNATQIEYYIDPVSAQWTGQN